MCGRGLSVNSWTELPPSLFTLGLYIDLFLLPSPSMQLGKLTFEVGKRETHRGQNAVQHNLNFI